MARLAYKKPFPPTLGPTKTGSVSKPKGVPKPRLSSYPAPRRVKA